MASFDFNFCFRRTRSMGRRKDHTEVSFTGSIVLVVVLILALLVATGVIAPDVFARIMDRTLPWRAGHSEVVSQPRAETRPSDRAR
jgi:hypothetical protein